MSKLTPNEFSYKMFTAPKTKITEKDLIDAIVIFKDYWTAEELEKSIKKVGYSPKVKNILINVNNPLVTRLCSDKHSDAKFVILFAYDISNEYLTAQEYQLILNKGLLVNTLIHVNIAKKWTFKERYHTYLNIINRMPKTTQSRILIRYLNKLLKEYPNGV